MSTKKEKCCDANEKTNGQWHNEDCYSQSESIEWEKEARKLLQKKFREVEVVMSVPDMEECVEDDVDSAPFIYRDEAVSVAMDVLSQAITTAVAKRDKFWIEEGIPPIERDAVRKGIATREKELAEEVEKIRKENCYSENVGKHKCDSVCEAMQVVLSIIQH